MSTAAEALAAKGASKAAQAAAVNGDAAEEHQDPEVNMLDNDPE